MYSPSQSRTLILTERVAHRARLKAVDVAFLLEHHRAQVEVVPTGQRQRYRLTALGCVGVLAAPTCRLVIRPKIPLANVFALLDPLAEAPSAQDVSRAVAGIEVLEFLAGQLARRLEQRVAAGLHRAYQERCEQGTILQGRLDLPAQLRAAPGRKDQLHGRFDELSVDVPCNRVVKATAEGLLISPLLGSEVRAALRRALVGFDGVASVPLDLRGWEAIENEPMPADYRPLLDLCRLLAESLAPGEAAGMMAGPTFLLDLERVFERHITRGVIEAFPSHQHHSVSVQRTHTVNQAAGDQPDISVRPDLSIDCEGRPVLIVDAKWKRLPRSLVTADLYQVLAYGTTLGAQGVALVYPGKKWRSWEYHFTHTPLRLVVYTLPVAGTRQACVRCARRLGRALGAMVRL